MSENIEKSMLYETNDAVRALNKVDFPTLGSPTIPQLNPIRITLFYIL